MAYDVTKLTRLSHLKALAQRSEEKFATKKALAALQSTVDGIVSVGGEANVLNGVKVNGTALTIANKMVDILIATGSANGTVAVNGVDVSVKGLAALAYKAEVSYDDLAAALKAVIDAKAEASVVATLVGDDTGKSARTIANEELAKQLIAEGAKESLDTLAEIAAWIQEHPESASAMNEAITALQNKLAGIPTDKTVKVYVDEAIAALNIGNYATTAWVSEQLANYSTTEQMNAAIKVVDDKFANYKTATETEAAIKAVDDKFASYSTTEQMNAAIKVVDDKFAGYKTAADTEAAIKAVDDKFVNYYTSAQVDAMIATDAEVAEMLNAVIPAEV